MSKYRHRRTAVPATPFTNPLEPGEIAVNTANRQIAVGDAAAGTTGTPKPLLAIRYFDTAAQYVTNEFVVNGTALYRSNKATGPGAFVAADWQMMVGSIDPQYVAKAGDVMTGPLSLPAAAPTTGVQATNKAYVDALVALKASVLVSDVAPTPTPIDSTLWYCTLDGQLYIRYNDGNSTAWVIAAPQPDSSNYVNLIGSSAVRYDVAQTLTAPQQIQARTNVYAAPLDALAYSGMQLNGGMAVSQELGTLGITAAAPTTYNAKYVVDNWRIEYKGSFSFNAAPIDSHGYTSVDPFFGHPKALVVNVTAAQAALAVDDLLIVSTFIEGYRVARLNFGWASASPITVGFVFVSTLAGTYSGAIRNGATSIAYPFSFTVGANVSTYVTVTIPGCTTGTWTADNTIGLGLDICLASGTKYTAPANAWGPGNCVGVNGTFNGVSAVATFYITGVVVLPGTEAPSAARSALIMRPFDQELITCKRYWQLVMPDARFTSTGPAGILSYAYTAVEMRTIPTITQVAAGTNANLSSALLVQYSTRPGELRVSLVSAAAGDCYCTGRTYSLDARL